MSASVDDLARLRDALRERILGDPSLKPESARGGRVRFLCPWHESEDSTPSGWLGDRGFDCKGCGQTSNLRDLAEKLGVPLTWENGKASGYTLERYAADKGFAVNDLTRWGLSDLSAYGPDQAPAVRIPYYGADGKRVLAVRIRAAATGKRRFRWKQGTRPALYGLDKLARVGRPGARVLLVEGESDCHACWSHRVLAVGVPGAASWDPSWASQLAGYELFAWQEPGAAGEAFVRALAGSFPTLRVISHPDYKDPAEMRRVDPTGFRERLDALFADARPVEPPPASPPSAASSPGGPDGWPLTDLGNAERLVAQHGADLRYVGAWSRWLAWDSQRWREDTTGEADRRAVATVRGLYAKAPTLADRSDREAITSWARKCEAEARLSSMVRIARTFAGVAIEPAAMDTHPLLLSVENGTIDLQTGELRQHRREDLITKMVPIRYDESARCPAWLSFLNRVLASDPELIDFVRRAVGYSLTGDTREQVLFFLHGSGANGKSTFLELLHDILGEYAKPLDFNSLLATGNDGGPRSDIAALFGARLVTASEAGDGRRFSEETIKQLTGGDTITCRRLYQDFFTFRPTFKLFLMANHKPTIRGSDHAIWRRFRMVPFTVTIPPAERDPLLKVRLRRELPGILNWAVGGCLEWLEKGLGEPSAVMAATEHYRSEMDVIGRFIEDACEVHPTATVGAGALYQAYQRWCSESGEREQSQTAFGRQLGDRGFDKDKIGGAWCRVGLRLRAGGSAPGEPPPVSPYNPILGLELPDAEA